MKEHLVRGALSKPSDLMAQGLEVEAVDGTNYLLF